MDERLNVNTSKQDLDIFALLGQSNMDGTGELGEFDNTPDERILRVTRSNTLEVATEPLNEGKRIPSRVVPLVQGRRS